MPDVFISHSSEDAKIAQQVVSVLEGGGLSCWIAPRDVPPGSNWGDAIIRGLEACRVMVLLFSNSSNQSQYVFLEIERAVKKELIIIPFRIDDAHVSRSLELFLMAKQWLDGQSPPLAARIADLLHHVRAALDTTVRPPDGGVSPPNHLRPEQKRPRSRLSRLWAPSPILLMLCGVLLWLSLSRNPSLNSVVIGQQVWMAENLNVDRFNNGDPIPEAKSPEEWAKAAAAKTPAGCYWGNVLANGKAYGRLYNWYAVADSRGLAPPGFHVPTKEELARLLIESGTGFLSVREENFSEENS